jgi:KDO2-lipid IV(A) lauroyltransferase
MIFRAAIWLFARIPLPILAAFTWVITWLWWVVVPIRKRLGVQNFHSVFPDLPAGPHLRRMFYGMVLGYFEILREIRSPVVRLDVDGVPKIRELLAQGKGLIVVCGHLGSWDLSCSLVVRNNQLPATAVVKIPTNPEAARLMEDFRHAVGGELISGRGTMAQVYQHLERKRLIAMFLDQRYKYGVIVPFFGRPAWTSAAAAVPAAKLGTPVWFYDTWRVGIGHHAAHFYGPIPMTGDVEKDTTEIMRWYEEAIRRRPHNWLWLHDRWKPLGEKEAAARPPEEAASAL